jgi:hypothetical protein
LLVEVERVEHSASTMVMDRLVASHQLIVSKHRAMEDLLPSLAAVAEKVDPTCRVHRHLAVLVELLMVVAVGRLRIVRRRRRVVLEMEVEVLVKPRPLELLLEVMAVGFVVVLVGFLRRLAEEVAVEVAVEVVEPLALRILDPLGQHTERVVVEAVVPRILLL